MTLAEFAVRKKVTVVMVTMALILVGVIAFLRLPQELFPHINFPQVTVVTDYANAAPEEIETLITKPIEEAVGSVSGLKRIESISREGRSTVQVTFDWGQDIDVAALAVREKIDLIKERLPKESDDPVVLKFDPLAKPIMILSVTGSSMEPVRLKLLAERMLKHNLEKVEGVASVTVSGGANREIQVDIDQARLQASHLSLLEVIESIEKTNVSYPAGSIKKGLYEYLIRTVGEYRSVKEVEYTVAGVDTVKEFKKEDTRFVERSGEGPRETLDSMREEVKQEALQKRLVLVRDIAEVVDGTAERTSVSRYNAKENISISIQKQASANTIQLVDRLKRALDLMKADVESRGLQYDIIYDHSTFIRNSLKNLMNEAATGCFNAFLVLLFFLRTVAGALLVTVSIPITILGVFFFMSIFNISLNIMSLGGLALAVGMIVDTSIVVLENIFRRRQLGEDAEEAAIRGTDEVSWAVVGSNLTTIVVFFPLLVFVPGLLGQIMKDLSWTVIFSQIISTLLPLTLITMLSLSFKIKLTEYKPWAWTTRFLEPSLAPEKSPLEHQRFIAGTILFISLVIAGTIMLLLPQIDREVLPKVDQGQFLIKVDMPIGTRLEVTDRVCSRIESELKNFKEVKDINVTVGAEKSREGEVKVETLRTSQAVILVSLDKKRKRSSAQVVHELRERLKEVDLEEAMINPEVQESEFQFTEGGSKPVLIEVKGFDFKVMDKLVERIKKQLEEVPGVIAVQDDMGEPTQETKLEIDKEHAALYGISAMDISLTAKAAIEGVVATKYREEGKEYDIRVRLSEKDRSNIENLHDLLLYSQVLDQLLSLKAVATVVKGLGPSEIRHINQERTTTVSADIHKNYQSKDVLRSVQKMLKNLEIPNDFQVVLSGKAKEIRQSYAMLAFAFALSVILIYMIMASLFESFLQPFIIMFTVPLSFFGIVLGLFLTGTSINLTSILGMIMLGGVVVNNGIVLIEYINQIREQGVDFIEATLQAIQVRTRPILMSAFTTVAALIPLALGFGEGSELRQPMAITVMGGLLSSTFLTLVVIPLLYILVTYVTLQFAGYEEEEGQS